MTVHRIRLGSAWQLIVPALVTTDASVVVANISLPVRGDVIQNIPADRPFELRRSFNRPSNLDRNQLVKLTFTGLVNGTRVRLNGLPVSNLIFAASGKAGDFAVDVRQLLRPHNEICLEFATNLAPFGDEAMILESAAMEIEEGE